jgi:hypothetical protein
VHWECRQWQHNVALSGSIPLQPAVQQGLRVEFSWYRYRAGIPWTLVDTSSFADKTLLSTLTSMRHTSSLAFARPSFTW